MKNSTTLPLLISISSLLFANQSLAITSITDADESDCYM
jgi:hypothetical protein